MSGRTFKARLDALLIPLGFVRDGRDWSRVRDGIKETVNLQVSNVAGSTINLQVVDVEAARLAEEITGDSGDFYMGTTQRIGRLIDNYDHWWKSDGAGPAELTEAVRLYGLPFFDLAHSPENRAIKRIERGTGGRWHEPTMIRLAISLYRLGEVEEALEVLSTSPPKLAVPAWVARVERVRQWIEDHRGG